MTTDILFDWRDRAHLARFQASGDPTGNQGRCPSVAVVTYLTDVRAERVIVLNVTWFA